MASGGFVLNHNCHDCDRGTISRDLVAARDFSPHFNIHSARNLRNLTKFLLWYRKHIIPNREIVGLEFCEEAIDFLRSQQFNFGQRETYFLKVHFAHDRRVAKSSNLMIQFIFTDTVVTKIPPGCAITGTLSSEPEAVQKAEGLILAMPRKSDCNWATVGETVGSKGIEICWNLIDRKVKLAIAYCDCLPITAKFEKDFADTCDLFGLKISNLRGAKMMCEFEEYMPKHGNPYFTDPYGFEFNSIHASLQTHTWDLDVVSYYNACTYVLRDYLFLQTNAFDPHYNIVRRRQSPLPNIYSNCCPCDELDISCKGMATSYICSYFDRLFHMEDIHLYDFRSSPLNWQNVRKLYENEFLIYDKHGKATVYTRVLNHIRPTPFELQFPAVDHITI